MLLIPPEGSTMKDLLLAFKPPGFTAAPDPTKQKLRPDAAGAYLRGKYGFGAKRTLDKLRVIGGGPLYRRCGRMILYDPEDLDAWAQAKIGPLQRSTSETPPRGGENPDAKIDALSSPDRLTSDTDLRASHSPGGEVLAK